MENKCLKFLYNTIIGRCFLKIASSHVVANLCATYLNSKLSKIRIKRFIKNNNIDMSEYVSKEYDSFNDFFIRKIKKDKRKIENGVVAVCDSKLSVYEIDNNTSFEIKNSIYTIQELIRENPENYEYALVFRLSVNDCHHYIFPDDGKIKKTKYIKGVLHTVQPIAFKKYKVFTENTRNVTFLECNNLGKVCYIEVGAMLIGKICNETVTTFEKGKEKGHFEFGGSTIVLLVEKNKIKIKKDFLENTIKGFETPVKLGEKIGDYRE